MRTISRIDIRFQLPLLLLSLLALAATACGPRYARLTIGDAGGLTVELRAQIEDGEAVDRGFDHPATISPVRVTNILSRIDVRPEGEKNDGRRPAIHAQFLYDLGDLVSTALAKADSSQEVVVRAVRKDRRFGIFTQKFLTSFVTYVSADLLYIHLARVDDEVETNLDGAYPEPWADRQVMGFKAIASEGVVRVGPQAVAVAWRDPLFRSAGRVRVGPGGRLIRREILLEGPTGETEPPAPETSGP
jgi:hypothetical protein